MRTPLSSPAGSPGSQAVLSDKQQEQELRRLCRILRREGYEEHVERLLEEERRADRALRTLRLALLAPSKEQLLAYERSNDLKVQERREMLLGLWSDERSERALGMLRGALFGPV
ncbi:hypothetical protein PG985_003641 [Apiospora marii]|uniref:Uncharacterized protein n=1 Tax=Apiospora marii TaxID=335849 RepID=A0ABR1SJ82_9PEZI